MLKLLEGYRGSLNINGTPYDNVDIAMETLKDYEGELEIVFNPIEPEPESQKPTKKGFYKWII